MDQQTAVEYAVKWLTPFVSVQQKYIDELLKEAKEMEKQSLEKFYEFGLNDGYNDSFEQRYNETFKNQ